MDFVRLFGASEGWEKGDQYSLFTFQMHPEHVSLLVEVFLHERVSFVFRYVHVFEDLGEPLVDLLKRELEDEILDVLHFIVVGFVGGQGPGAVGAVGVAVASLGGPREERVQEAARLVPLVLRHRARNFFLVFLFSLFRFYHNFYQFLI